MKIVFDTSSIISISSNCMLHFIKPLSENNEFIVTPSVVRESISKPINIHRFELNAIRIENALMSGMFIQQKASKRLENITSEILYMSNHVLYQKNRPITIIQEGEAESIALLKMIDDVNTLAIDERITRTLLEEPAQIKNYISRKYKIPLRVDKDRHSELIDYVGEINIVRSAELVARAFEKGIMKENFKNYKKALEGALYAMKYGGCSITHSEIEEYVRNFRVRG